MSVFKYHEARYIRKNTERMFDKNTCNGNGLVGVLNNQRCTFTYFGEEKIHGFSVSFQKTREKVYERPKS